MKIYLSLLMTGVLVLAGCQTNTAAPDKSRAEIEARTQAYAAAMLQGAAATGSFYAEDGEMISGTTSYRGPQGVREFLDPILVTVDLVGQRMDSEKVEVFGDVAYQWGIYTQHAGPKGQAPKEYRGRFVIKWRREPDGRWLIVRLMTNP
jgi:ketosteroid isomerase-like protein